MSATCDVRTLKPISIASIKLTDKGQMWCDLAMHSKKDPLFPGNRLIAHYGSRSKIPPPTVVVDEQEWQLWFYWEADGQLIIIGFDYGSDWTFS